MEEVQERRRPTSPAQAAVQMTAKAAIQVARSWAGLLPRSLVQRELPVPQALVQAQAQAQALAQAPGRAVGRRAASAVTAWEGAGRRRQVRRAASRRREGFVPLRAPMCAPTTLFGQTLLPLQNSLPFQACSPPGRSFPAVPR